MIEIAAIYKPQFNGYHLIARDKARWPVPNSRVLDYCYAMEYAERLRPPHYPVPAIVYDVEYDGSCVALVCESEDYAIEWTANGVERLRMAKEIA